MPVNNKRLYNARIKTYPDGRQNLTVFSKQIFNPEKFEIIDDFYSLDAEGLAIAENNKKIRDDEKEKEYYREYSEFGIRTDSLKRSKEKIFDIAFANVNLWKYMVTLTLDKEKIDRYSSEEVQKKFTNWLKHSVQRKNINYILVSEYHKDRAIHFHGLLSDGFNYSDSGKVDENGRKIFDILDYPFGFARAVPIDKDTESNCCKYITKYMTKDFEKIFGKMYWAGGKDLVRNCNVSYCDLDFDDIPSEAYQILNSNYEVKYLMRGTTI